VHIATIHRLLDRVLGSGKGANAGQVCRTKFTAMYVDASRSQLSMEIAYAMRYIELRHWTQESRQSVSLSSSPLRPPQLSYPAATPIVLLEMPSILT
jgi:hypothetical protein